VDHVAAASAQWKGLEYTDYPRGRVLFHSTEEVFLVYSSQAIVNSPKVRAMILAEFQTAIGGDEVRSGLSLRERDTSNARRGL
jgi:hypothetical protein